MDLCFRTLLGGLIFLATTPAAAASIFYAPAYCEPEELTLVVQNLTSENQRLWTQVRFDEELQEQHHDLEAKASIKIRGSDFLPDKRGFSIKTWQKNTLKISAQCKDTKSVTLSDLTSPQIQHTFPLGTKNIRIHLLNLFLKSNVVKLKAFDNDKHLIAEQVVTLDKYYDTKSILWSLETPATRVDIVSDERVNSLLFYKVLGEQKSSLGKVDGPVLLTPDENKIYFLVSTKSSRPEEAFVVGISDTQTIAIAREQIRNPKLEKIIVAGIELGNGSYNRAFLSRDKAPYSWSVNRVDAFADFAHIDCDGSPDLTEERLAQKLNEGGRICFWRYRITRELSSEEVATGLLKP